MRQIGLYKAKAISNGQWVQGNLMTFGKKCQIVTFTDEGELNTSYEVDPKTVAENVIFDDKRPERNIFNGDIVKLFDWGYTKGEPRLLGEAMVWFNTYQNQYEMAFIDNKTCDIDDRYDLFRTMPEFTGKHITDELPFEYDDAKSSWLTIELR